MNEQQMAQLLAYMQKQMDNSQQNMADLPQRAMQAGATPTIGSKGVVLSPDPVRRIQQGNEAWRERFPNPVENAARLGMTPEALLASRGNDATNQWAQLGGVVGVDPQKQRDMNRAASQYAAFAKSQREGTNGVTSEIPSSEYVPGANYRVGQAGSGSVAADGTRTITSPYGTASMGPQSPQGSPASPPQAPPTPATAGVPSGDFFSGAASAAQGIPAMMGNAASSIEDAYRQAVMPNVPINTSVAPSVEGSGLRKAVIQGLSFIPNMALGAGSTIYEGAKSIMGNPVDVPQVNLGADFLANLKNVFGAPQDSSLGMDANSPVGFSFQGGGTPPTPPAPGFAGAAYQATPTAGGIPGQQANQYAAPGAAPEGSQQKPQTLTDPNKPAAAPAQPNFFNQTPGFNQGQTTPLTPDQTRNMFMTDEEKRRRSQTQPMMAGR
jgi:hypothetical protein